MKPFYKKIIISLFRMYVGLFLLMAGMQGFLIIFPFETTALEYKKAVSSDMDYDEETNFWYDSKNCNPNNPVSAKKTVLFYQGNGGNQAMQVDFRQPMHEKHGIFLTQQHWKGSCVYQYEYPSFGMRAGESRINWFKPKELEQNMLRDTLRLIEKLNRESKKEITFAAESLGTEFATSAIVSQRPDLFNNVELFVPLNDLTQVAASRYKIYPKFLYDWLVFIKPTQTTTESLCYAINKNKTLNFDLFLAQNDEVVGIDQGYQIESNIKSKCSTNVSFLRNYWDVKNQNQPLPKLGEGQTVRVTVMKGVGHNDYHKIKLVKR